MDTFLLQKRRVSSRKINWSAVIYSILLETKERYKRLLSSEKARGGERRNVYCREKKVWGCGTLSR